MMAAPVIRSFEDAERAAVRASAVAPAVRPATDPVTDPAPEGDRPQTPDSVPAAGAAHQPSPPLAAAMPPATRATVVRDEKSSATGQAPIDPVPTATSQGAPGVRPKRQPGETAPESLLRPPAAAASVADDFFDGLVRRVEGDR